MTFGQVIAEARKNANLSQKELAERIKKENGEAISPQYLNDIERDRRNPSSDYLIEEFARVLNIDVARLYYWARTLPADATSEENEQKFVKVFKAFRREVKKS